MEVDTTKCYFTDVDCLQVSETYSKDRGVYNSPLCGQYKFYNMDDAWVKCSNKHKTACYLFYNKVIGDKCYLLVPSSIQNWGFSRDSKFYITLTEQDIENWYPKTFAEKIDYILLYLNKVTHYHGEKVKFTFKDLIWLFF